MHAKGGAAPPPLTTERWRRIEEIFHQVVVAPEKERGALLDRLCGGDASLRDELAAIGRAESRAEAVALLLMTPEFQRR